MEKTVKTLINKIPNKYRYAIISAVIFGLCAHLYQLTNKIPNYDEYGQTPGGLGATLEFGRWGLELLGVITGKVTGWFSFPMINGLVSLIFIILSACALIYCFEIEDGVICALVGAICIVFPTVTSTLFFMFTAPYYCFGLFLCCVSAVIIIKALESDRSNVEKVLFFVLSCVLAATGIGIYQAYAPVFICIFLIKCITYCLKEEYDFRKVLFSGIVYCVGIASYFLLYFGINKIVLKLSGTIVSGYKNIDKMTEVHLGGLLFSFIRTYQVYFALLRGEDVLQINPTPIIKFTYLLLFLFTIFLLAIIIKDKSKKMSARVLAIVGSAMLPAAIFFIFVMANGEGVYTLMIYSGVFLFIFPLVLYDQLLKLHENEKSGKIFNGFSWVSVIATFLSILLFIWFDNGNYQGLQYTHYHDMAYYQTLMTQIKSLDEFSDELPVAIIGEFNDNTSTAGSLMEYWFNVGGKSESNINYQARLNIWQRYLGFSPEFIEDKEQLKKISESEEVKNMPKYPNSGAIAVVDGIIVVKAGEIQE